MKYCSDTFRIALLAAAAMGCGSDGIENELGRATVEGSIMGDSFDRAIAWSGEPDTGGSLISIQETGSPCSTVFGAGSTLRIVFNCSLEAGSFTVKDFGSRDCPDDIVASFSVDGGDALFATGGTIELEQSGASLTGTFEIAFDSQSLTGSFHLRDCGDL